MSEFVLCK